MTEFINLSLTWFLVGLIWIIQIVHYPTFRFFKEESKFLEFHHFHTKSILRIVAPTMLLEVILGTHLVWRYNFSMEYLVPFLMIGGIWVSTLLLQIPLHAKLADERNEANIEKLISTNWIRTILWTLKGCWLLYLLL